MTSTNEHYNKNLGLNMSKRVSDNAISLQEFAREANEEAGKYAKQLIELYQKRHITREPTVRRLIGEMLNGTERKQKLGLKHAKAAITKYEAKVPKVRGAEKPITRRLRAKTNMREDQPVEQPITRRLRTKTNMKVQKQVLGEKIFKLFRNRLKFRITEEKAFKSGAVSVILEPVSVGAVPASDLDVFAARSYLIARKRIPKDAHFEIYASCSLKINKTDRMIHITSEKYNSKNLSKFFENYVNKIKNAVQSDESVSIKKFEYNFIVIPSGSGRTTNRDEAAIMNKRSVLRVVNDDKNCFWYAMAYLMNPKNRQIRNALNIKQRIRIASQICSKSKLEWDKPMPLHFICLVEETFNININIVDKYNIPMLGSNVNIFNCLMYKSENRHREHYFLLYDSINEHYDCITDIKKFLAVRCFCFNCFKGFINKSDYEKHECDTNLSKKNRI